MKTKMLMVFTSLVVLMVLFSGCKKDDKPNYSELILGMWVNTHVNNEAILTDASYSMEFKSDHTENYAIGFQLDETNKAWQENDHYTYNVVGDLIVIDGVDILDKAYHMEFKILTLDQSTLKYSIQAFSIDGITIPISNIFTCKRIVDDLSADFTGVWYGKCTSDNTTDTKFHYWEYFSDGSYNYYYLDENNNWIKKSDNEGRYFLYGNLFASNYSNDLISGGTGLAYECWNFNIVGNIMTWSGLRENDIIVTYEMEKVDEAPTTR